MAGLLK
jgi:hypothetical protein